jgi:hypothetical protein
MIGGMIVNALAGGIANAAVEAFKLYQNKQINEAEFESRVRQSALESASKIETAWAKAAADITAETQKTVRDSFNAPSWVARNAWAFVVVSQTLVLLWYQVGVPALVYFTATPWPRTGDLLLQWAYALVAGALGIGWMQARSTGVVETIVGSLRKK